MNICESLYRIFVPGTSRQALTDVSLQLLHNQEKPPTELQIQKIQELYEHAMRSMRSLNILSLCGVVTIGGVGMTLTNTLFHAGQNAYGYLVLLALLATGAALYTLHGLGQTIFARSVERRMLELMKKEN